MFMWIFMKNHPEVLFAVKGIHILHLSQSYPLPGKISAYILVLEQMIGNIVCHVGEITHNYFDKIFYITQ